MHKRAAFGFEQREVFLVQPHGQDQAFRRYIKERLVERAGVHRGVFHQRGDLIEQCPGLGGTADCCAQGGAVLGRSACDGVTALERKRVVWGKSVSVRVGIGGGRNLKKKRTK